MAKVLILICLLLVATLSKTAPVLDEEGRSKVEKAKQVLFIKREYHIVINSLHTWSLYDNANNIRYFNGCPLMI